MTTRKQTKRQAEIEKLAREYMRKHPEATQSECCRAINVDVGRFTKLLQRGSIAVSIPTTETTRRLRAPIQLPDQDPHTA